MILSKHYYGDKFEEHVMYETCNTHGEFKLYHTVFIGKVEGRT
jgi:hypothetical protein